MSDQRPPNEPPFPSRTPQRATPTVPKGSGGSGWMSVLGVFLGLFILVILPGILWGIVGGVASNTDSFGSGTFIVISGLVALAASVAIYFALYRAMKSSTTPNTVALTGGMKAGGITALILWAIGLVGFGLCIALLTQAYGATS